MARSRTELSRLLPQSLLWRSFLLLAVLMLASVAAWLALFSQAELDRRSEQIAQMISSLTNVTRTALVAADPRHRRRLLRELADLEGVQVHPANPDDILQPPPPIAFMHQVESRLVERLGPETRLAFGLNGEPGLFVRFRIHDGKKGLYWLALPRERITHHFPWQWVGWGAAVFLLSLAGAWWIVYRIVKPVEKERALLLAGISHDLRTPLTRLRMEIEMSVADEAARTGMEADIAEMDRTVGQFLDFARPDEKTAGKPVDLAELLVEVANRYGTRLATADFFSVTARVRPEALRRAVTNLIENALHHGSAPVELRLSTEADGHDVVISVLDRGPGIPPDQVTRLKQPFTRGETARTDAAGAGLGLAIVERIVRAESGRLELLSRPGGGLAARIILPIAR